MYLICFDFCLHCNKGDFKCCNKIEYIFLQLCMQFRNVWLHNYCNQIIDHKSYKTIFLHHAAMQNLDI